MLIGYDFGIANDITVDCQRGRLILKYDDESTDRKYEQSRESERTGGLL
jgi:hypothetical protein